MAQVGRLMKGDMGSKDVTELEQAARAKMKAEERAKLKAAEEATKLEQAMAAEKQRPGWGAKGVHALVNDEYGVEDENDSPVLPRRTTADGVNAASGGAYPVSENKNKNKNNPKKPPPPSAWAPMGFGDTKTESPKDAIANALSQAQKSSYIPAPAGEGSAVDNALKLLGESLTHERERADRLEAQLAQVTAQLLDAQAKAIDRLERENERWAQQKHK